MGLTRLRGFLRHHPKLALDTSIFIYQFEANPKYALLTDAIFFWLEQGEHEAVTSTITMTELLVLPYRDADAGQVDAYFGLLSTYPNLTWHAPDLDTADLAAQLRASHRLRTPDALQAATAIAAGATGLITNDAVFKRVGGFETLVLDEIL